MPLGSDTGGNSHTENCWLPTHTHLHQHALAMYLASIDT